MDKKVKLWLYNNDVEDEDQVDAIDEDDDDYGTSRGGKNLYVPLKKL